MSQRCRGSLLGAGNGIVPLIEHRLWKQKKSPCKMVGPGKSSWSCQNRPFSPEPESELMGHLIQTGSEITLPPQRPQSQSQSRAIQNFHNFASLHSTVRSNLESGLKGLVVRAPYAGDGAAWAAPQKAFCKHSFMWFCSMLCVCSLTAGGFICVPEKSLRRLRIGG